MKKRSIVILMGNPYTDSLCGALAHRYAEGAREAGHSVEIMNIGEMKFDPILHKGYREVQQLEPDLILFHTHVRAADHLVIVYPNWWGSMPALLKGFFDRAWIPGFAFRYYKTGIRARLHLWEELLSGKSARLIVTTNTNPFLLWVAFGDVTHTIKDNILRFAGMSVRTTIFGPSERMSDEERAGWLQKAKDLGKRGA